MEVEEIVKRHQVLHTQDGNQTPRISSITEKRRTLQPKLEISSKPVARPLNNIDGSSLRENLFLENFQILTYFLSNLLHTLLPVLE